MAENFIGEILLVPYNFAPRGYAFCEGQILFIAQNTALFSLLGTMYGGDGRTTFALPDLRGRVPMNSGIGAGLSRRDLGETGGEATHRLSTAEIPAHNHLLKVAGGQGTTGVPDGMTYAAAAVNARISAHTSSAPPSGLANQSAIAPEGGNQPHNNMQPYLVLNYAIALQGIFPARN